MKVEKESIYTAEKYTVKIIPEDDREREVLEAMKARSSGWAIQYDHLNVLQYVQYVVEVPIKEERFKDDPAPPPAGDEGGAK